MSSVTWCLILLAAAIRRWVALGLQPFMRVTWVQIPCMKGAASSRGPQVRPPYPALLLLWIKAKCINIHCAHRGMEMVSNNTQAAAFKRCSVGNKCAKKM